MECFFPNGAPSCWGARDRQPSVPSSSGASSSSSSSSSVSTDYGASSTAEDVTAGLDLTGRVYVVTGGTGAIGAEACRVLISRGASIVLAARDAKRANATVASIEGAAAKVIVQTCDLASMRSVRAFAAAFCALAMPLHGILCAAGIVAEPLFDLTEDGVERHFAINHLSHFLLVHELTNELVRTAASSGVQGRVVLVASSAHHFAYRVRRGVTKPSRGIDFANLNEPFGYTARGAYGQSKVRSIHWFPYDRVGVVNADP
ncbi:uncharacterized protein MICPUCDRAFT_61092 [Micromonas pusilla CCMP1545]|uniref:Predicted protein n=1 Tax=Micromonas pusilla (strain CCMP1545) TaxID=564608 RepID=C1MGM2_MICPC|nr:uncharacterized protein MICPUCDRAFT_61092 [Micromonas pusilla CCMP1545]EEH60051.1 predicted protein [Micromonas pusilla CCMP1545]|eukprot:XP_003054799.1 predicted protein [Micromonas pusilla CCMP1545]